MSRYIDANALKAKKTYSHERHEYIVPVAEIDWLPTVDAVPVVHGHWEIVPDDYNANGYYKMRCSVCGETLWSVQSEELYCCKCGARMDGEVKNNE